MDKTTIVQPGQCLEDIALQEYGAVDAMGWLLEDNRAVLAAGFCTDLVPGTELRIRKEPMDRDMLTCMRSLRVVPATLIEAIEPVGEGGDHSDDHNDDHSID